MNIETRLRMTQIDEQKMENIVERKNIKDIETRLKMTRSEHSSASNCKKHGTKVNSEPDPSSSDLSDSSSSDSAPKINKSRKKKERLKHQTDALSEPSSSDDSDSYNFIRGQSI